MARRALVLLVDCGFVLKEHELKDRVRCQIDHVGDFTAPVIL